jgi:hypothetical protein
MSDDARRVEQTGSKKLEPCSCCGGTAKRVWGFVHDRYATEAAYFVEWIAENIAKHGARFDLIVGPWGHNAQAAERVAVSLAFRRVASQPQFMVTDANEGPLAANSLVGRAMSRDEVLNSSLAQQVFAIVDAIWQQDDRIRELTNDAA